jgi:NAD(P)-dependent dehydrogenase (short-subunit alcohol dehydrogenase family)
MQLFENETAVVTGAGNGIGRAIALALAEQGVDTIFADINEDTVQQAVAQGASFDGACYGWSGDLGQRDQCAALKGFAKEKLGTTDMFVHSASPPRAEKDHLFAVDDDTWRQMHAVNVDAAFYLCREFARDMIKAKTQGRFLLLTSLHVNSPRNLPHYSSSKGAMDMLMKELAKSLGKYGIRANALVPGAIAAGGFKADPAMAKFIPMGRLGNAQDLAPMALGVLSNKMGGYVTGTSIVVDGGIALTNWFDAPQFDDSQLE